MDVHGDLVAVCLFNNSLLPFQPFYSRFGGVLLFRWEAVRTNEVPVPDGKPTTEPRIWHDPRSGILHIEGAIPGERMTIQVLDAQGRLVQEEHIRANPEHISVGLRSSASGIHHVRIITVSGRYGKHIAIGLD